MNPERHRSAGVFLAILSLGVFFFVLHFLVMRGVELNAASRIRDMTESCAAILDDWLRGHTLAADVAADLADSRDNARRLYRDLARTTGGNADICAALHLESVGITLFDKSGVWNFGSEAERYAQWAELFFSATDLVAMRGPVEPLRGEERELLFLRALLDADGARHGALALRIPLGALSGRLNRIPSLVRGDRRYFLADHRGQVLVDNRGGGGQELRPEGDPSLRRLLDGDIPLQSAPVQIFQGVEYLAAGADVGETGWRLYSFAPLDREIRVRPLLTGSLTAGWLLLSTFVLLLNYHSSKHGQYKDLSRRDHLTGVGNRLAFEEALLALGKKDVFPLCLIILDVDGLKILNDSLGHKAGDALLRRVAMLLQRSLRENDHIYRIGGDEFAVLLPGASRQVGQALMERISAKAEQMRAHSGLPPIFASQGLAEARNGEDLAGLFIAADKAMYESKKERSPIARATLLQWVENSGQAADRREQ